MKIIVDRWGSLPFGTFGQMTVREGDDVLFKARTVEQPWNNNEPFKSCIPSGIYSLEDFYSDKYGHTYAMVGGTVSKYKEARKERYACLIHPANKASELSGCMAVGYGNGWWEDELAVVKSRATTEELFTILHSVDTPIEMIIKQPQRF